MDKRLRLLPLLRCFEMAAQCESYSLAAKQLNITQAAVSQQIRNLEESLNCKLFYRAGRKMKLTANGKILCQHTQAAFSELSSGFDRISKEGVDGEITVTAGPSLASMWLVPRLWRFSVENPYVKVKILASAEFEDLKYSEIDVAIRHSDNPGGSVYSEPLFVDPIFPVCSPNLIKDVGLEHVIQIAQCWLVEAIDRDRFSWQTWFKQHDLDVDSDRLKWIEVTTWEMGINAVLAGHGICMASGCMVSDWLEKGLLVKPFNKHVEPGLPLTLLYDQESPRLERIKLFSDWVVEEMKTTKEQLMRQQRQWHAPWLDVS